MDDADLDLSQGDEVEEQQDTSAENTSDDLVAKLKKENHGLRSKLRRAEISTEYGAEIAELIPDVLPAKDWKDYAAKLAALKGEVVQETSEEQPVSELSEAQGESLREREARLATAGGSHPAGARPAHSEMSGKEIRDLGKRDPAAAMQAIKDRFG